MTERKPEKQRKSVSKPDDPIPRGLPQQTNELSDEAVEQVTGGTAIVTNET
jgi:hypothetical protein